MWKKKKKHEGKKKIILSHSPTSIQLGIWAAGIGPPDSVRCHHGNAAAPDACHVAGTTSNGKFAHHLTRPDFHSRTEWPPRGGFFGGWKVGTELRGRGHVARSEPLAGSSRAVTVVPKRGLRNLMKGKLRKGKWEKKIAAFPRNLNKERKKSQGAEESGCKLGRYCTGHSDKTYCRSIR